MIRDGNTQYWICRKCSNFEVPERRTCHVCGSANLEVINNEAFDTLADKICSEGIEKMQADFLDPIIENLDRIIEDCKVFEVKIQKEIEPKSRTSKALVWLKLKASRAKEWVLKAIAIRIGA